MKITISTNRFQDTFGLSFDDLTKDEVVQLRDEADRIIGLKEREVLPVTLATINSDKLAAIKEVAALYYAQNKNKILTIKLVRTLSSENGSYLGLIEAKQLTDSICGVSMSQEVK